MSHWLQHKGICLVRMISAWQYNGSSPGTFQSLFTEVFTVLTMQRKFGLTRDAKITQSFSHTGQSYQNGGS